MNTTMFLRPDMAHTARRWTAGQQHLMSELPIRTRQGCKAVDDLVIEWFTPSGWVPIDYQSIGFLVDFLYENEHVLYPPSVGYLGGEKLMEHLRRSVQNGWSKAGERLQAEIRSSRSDA